MDISHWLYIAVGSVICSNQSGKQNSNLSQETEGCSHLLDSITLKSFYTKAMNKIKSIIHVLQKLSLKKS